MTANKNKYIIINKIERIWELLFSYITFLSKNDI